MGPGFSPWSRRIPRNVKQLSPGATPAEAPALEPVLCMERSLCREQPAHSRGAALPTAGEKSAHSWGEAPPTAGEKPAHIWGEARPQLGAAPPTAEEPPTRCSAEGPHAPAKTQRSQEVFLKKGNMDSAKACWVSKS